MHQFLVNSTGKVLEHPVSGQPIQPGQRYTVPDDSELKAQDKGVKAWEKVKAKEEADAKAKADAESKVAAEAAKKAEEQAKLQAEKDAQTKAQADADAQTAQQQAQNGTADNQ